VLDNRSRLRQYHLPRANPPKAIKPTSAIIRPRIRLQKMATTIPMMTRMPPNEMPPIPLRSAMNAPSVLPFRRESDSDARTGSPAGYPLSTTRNPGTLGRDAQIRRFAARSENVDRGEDDDPHDVRAAWQAVSRIDKPSVPIRSGCFRLFWGLTGEQMANRSRPSGFKFLKTPRPPSLHGGPRHQGHRSRGSVRWRQRREPDPGRSGP
jgi:hypothetical protein